MDAPASSSAAPVASSSSSSNTTPQSPSAPTSSGSVSSTGHNPVGSANVSAPNSKFADSTTTGTPPPNAAEATAAKAEAEAKRYKFKLKINGEETEQEFDEAALTARLQKEIAVEKRMQQAAEREKRIQAALEMGKKDPDQAFKALFGINAREYYEQKLAEEWDQMEAQGKMSPEERLRAEYEQKLSAKEAELKAIRDAEEAQKRSVVEQQVWERTEKDYVEALKSTDLPVSHETLELMADIGMMNLEQGIDLSPQQIAAEARERMSQVNQSLMRNLRGPQLVKYLGPEVVNEIRQHLVAEAKAKRAAPAPAPKVVADKDDSPMPKTRDSMKSWREFVRGD